MKNIAVIKLGFRKGFTLIELLAVISIIGLLSTVVITSVNSARSKARDAAKVMVMKQLDIALEQYFNDNGSYPIYPGTPYIPSLPASYSGGGNWDTIFKNSISPYISEVPLPAGYPAPTTIYAYYNSAPPDSVQMRWVNTSSGVIEKCLTITNGFRLRADLESSDSLSMNDGGISPRAFEIIKGEHTLVNGPGTCNW